MTESKSDEPLPSVETLDSEWRRIMAGQIDQAFDYFSNFITRVVSLAPMNLTWANADEEGELVDQRGFYELSLVEQEFLKGEFFHRLGFNPDILQEPLRSYSIQAPEAKGGESISWTGTAEVAVYQTARSNEDMFLHIVRDQEGKEVEYFVAPKDVQI